MEYEFSDLCRNCGNAYGKHHGMACYDTEPPYVSLGTTFVKAYGPTSDDYTSRWYIAKDKANCTNAKCNAAIAPGDLCVKHLSGRLGCAKCAKKYWRDIKHLEEDVVYWLDAISDEADRRYPSEIATCYWVITETEHKCDLTPFNSVCGNKIIPAGSVALMSPSSLFYCVQCMAVYRYKGKSGLHPPQELLDAVQLSRLPRNMVLPEVVTITSFGYKNGAPKASEDQNTRIVDIRKTIRNPWSDERLRSLTGLDVAVRKFINACPKTSSAIVQLLWLPYSGVSQVYIGCTGGRHRSVAFAEMLAEEYRSKGLTVNVIHRDLKQVEA